MSKKHHINCTQLSDTKIPIELGNDNESKSTEPGHRARRARR